MQVYLSCMVEQEPAWLLVELVSGEPCAARDVAGTHLLRTACSSTLARGFLECLCPESQSPLCPVCSGIVRMPTGQSQLRRLLRDAQCLTAWTLRFIDGRSAYSYVMVPRPARSGERQSPATVTRESERAGCNTQLRISILIGTNHRMSVPIAKSSSRQCMASMDRWPLWFEVRQVCRD